MSGCPLADFIVALRNEKGSYNITARSVSKRDIVALRNEKGSYNDLLVIGLLLVIVALRNEKGSYNMNKPNRATSPL